MKGENVWVGKCGGGEGLSQRGAEDASAGGTKCRRPRSLARGRADGGRVSASRLGCRSPTPATYAGR